MAHEAPHASGHIPFFIVPIMTFPWLGLPCCTTGAYRPGQRPVERNVSRAERWQQGTPQHALGSVTSNTRLLLSRHNAGMWVQLPPQGSQRIWTLIEDSQMGFPRVYRRNASVSRERNPAVECTSQHVVALATLGKRASQRSSTVERLVFKPRVEGSIPSVGKLSRKRDRETRGTTEPAL